MLHFSAAVAMLVFVGTAAVSTAGDFSHASCDSPQFETFMQSHLGHGKSAATGKLMPTRFDYGPITSATTVANTGNHISCEITVKLDTRGGTKSVRGVFSATLSAAGPTHWRWVPGY